MSHILSRDFAKPASCPRGSSNLSAIRHHHQSKRSPHILGWHSISCDYMSMKPTSHQGDTGLFLYACIKAQVVDPVPVPSKASLLSTFKVLVKRQEGIGQPIRHLYTDSEQIFRTISKGSFSRYLIRHGIRPHFSSPYRHEQSPAERPWQTIKASTIATMLQSRSPPKYWNYVVRAVAHTWNLLPLKSTGYTKSPHELMTERKPDVSHLVPIGMRAYVRRLDGEPPDRAHRETLRPNASVGRVIGYPSDYKNAYYILMDDGSVKVRRDVVIEANPPAAIHIPTDKPAAPNASRVAGRTTPAAPDAPSASERTPPAIPLAQRDAGRTQPAVPTVAERREPSSRARTRNVRLKDITEVPGTHRLTANIISQPQNNRSVLYDVILNDNPADFDNRIPMPSVIPPNPKSLLIATRKPNEYYELWRRSARKEFKAFLELNEISPDNQPGERAEHLKRIFALLAKCRFKLDNNTE